MSFLFFKILIGIMGIPFQETLLARIKGGMIIIISVPLD